MDYLLNAIAWGIIFALGASFGSFLNVVIYRLPAGMSLISPPSRCPHCEHKLGKTENIPVFGWLWLKGRCRWCRAPISLRYPIIEFITGWLFLFVFWQFGLNITTVAYWCLLSWLLALAMIDLDTMTLPNSLTQSGLVLGLLFQAILGWQQGQINGLINNLLFGVFGVVLGIWLLDAIAILGTLAFRRQAMGGGDPKLMAMIGAWLGWKMVLLTCILASAMGALIGGGAITLGLLKRKQPIPFGPFIALGGALSLFWGNYLINAYLKLFFPL